MGFIPLEFSKPTKMEAKAGATNVISKYKLLEASIVAVPSNQEALITAVKSMNLQPDFVKEYFDIDIEPEKPEIKEYNDKEEAEQLKKEIADKIIKIENDRAKGKLYYEEVVI